MNASGKAGLRRPDGRSQMFGVAQAGGVFSQPRHFRAGGGSAPAKGGFSRKIVSSRASPAPAKKAPLEWAARVVGGRAHRRNTCSDNGLIGAERAGRFPARIDGGNLVLEGGVGIESNHGLVYPRIKSGLRLASALNSVA